MNILLSMPNDSQSNNYIINALQDLGHKVIYMDHRAYLEECKKTIEPVFNIEKIDMFLALYLVPGKTYDIEFIRRMKTRFPNVKYCAWIFDATIGGEYCDKNEDFVAIAKEYDYFFTVCKSQVENFRVQGVNAFHLFEGATPYLMKTDDFDLDYKYDVSFIGQIGHPEVHQERLPLMKKIIDRFSKTLIFGLFFTDDPIILDNHSKRPTYNDIEHSKVVTQSRVNIGHSGWTELDEYFSARNYRIMLTGGFLLANRSVGAENVFKEGEEIAYYDNPDDCVKKIKYYLDNDIERHKIAKAGQKKVLENYTFNHSLSKMLEIIYE